MRSIKDSMTLLKNSISSIQTALNSKLGGGITNLRLSQVADKIRQIETQFTINLTINMPSMGETGRAIRIEVREENSAGNIVIQTSYGITNSNRTNPVANLTNLKVKKKTLWVKISYTYANTQTGTNSKTVSITGSGNYSVTFTQFNLDPSVTEGPWFEGEIMDDPSIESVNIPLTLETFEEIIITEE